MDENLLRERLTKYHFYHVIKLSENVQTPGWSEPHVLRLQETAMKVLRSLPLRNKRVLDIGCRDGLFSFEAEKMGASEVIGIDNDLSRGATEFLIPFFNSKVRMHELNLYDLTPQTFGLFDVVFCPGVLYHLRYPFWGLKLIHDVLKPNGHLLLETAVYIDENDRAMLYCPIGPESPYEPTSCTFFNSKGLIDSLASLGFVVHSVSYCQDKHLEWAKPWTSIKRKMRALLGLRRRLVLDRVTIACQRLPANVAAVSRKVDEYWHGTHRTHSNAEYSW
jgi:SAM-dependent methyltransferase